jgi:HTH-type transcriptional regulator / antitoxin HigA
MILRTGKMTVGIKTPNDRYLELIVAFPPRPIVCDADLEAFQRRVNEILDGGSLGEAERDYLRLLGILIYDYEEQHEPIAQLTQEERTIALAEEARG